MKPYRLAEAFALLSMAGLAGWTLGRVQVNNFALAEAWSDALLRRNDLARAQHPPRPPRACAIDRDQLLAGDTSEIARSARIVPAFVDGRAQGFKLYAVAPYSIFARLGLRNGDTIRRINGFDLTHPDHALEAYSAMKRASQILLDVERKGEPLQLACALR